MSLSELVRGYVEGQAQKQKKAQQIADAQAQKFEQGFKVSQAQRQASEADARMKQEQQRLDTEKQYAKIASNRQATDEQHKKNLDQIAESRLGLQRDISSMKIDFSDYSQKLKRHAKIYDDLIKGGASPDEAAKGADQIMADEVEAFEARKAAQQGAGQPAQGAPAPSAAGAPQQGQSQSGNPIMDMLHSMHQHTTQPPSERPDVLSRPLPAVAAANALKQAQAQQAQASTQRQQAIAASVKQNTQINNQILQSKKALTDSQRKLIDAKTSMVPAQVHELVARSALLQKQAIAVMANVKIASDREARLATEAKLKVNSSDDKARKELSARITSTRNQKDKLNKEMMANVTHAAELDIKFDKALHGKDASGNPLPPDIATMNTIKGLKAGVANQLADITAMYQDANSEYLAALVQSQKYGVTSIDTPTGKPDKKKNAAAQHAAASGIRPAAVNPPGTSHTAGAQPGLYTRPAPKRAGIRRNFRSMSKDELKKYIKDHGG